MFELAKVAGYLISPLTVVLGLGLLAWLCLVRRRPSLARAFAAAGFVVLWVASTPALGHWLIGMLEARHPAVSVKDTPAADAILVLGGALTGAHPPQRPAFGLGPAAGRVWHAAALYRAGRAKWVFISGGNQPGYEDQQPEGDAIAEMLVELGVPASAIRRETTSRTTYENARNVRRLLEAAGVRRVILVTSAYHMSRSVKTVTKYWAGSGIHVIPAATDLQVTETSQSPRVWLPSLEGLNSVSKGLKEFAGLVALAIM